MKNLRLVLILLPCLFLLACGKTSKIDPYDDRTAQDIYESGKSAINRGDYETAIKAFQGLEAHYPFGKYTEQAQLDVIYAHYKFDEQPAAVFAADRFIRLHPRFPQLDYVFYMKALSKFNENTGLLERFFPLDPTKRDTSAERDAFFLFADLVRRYPESPYAPDSRARMIYLRDSLAKHEFYAAEYLYRRGAYLGAINRLQKMISQYDGTIITAEALSLMTNAYNKMGLHDLENDSKRVLSLNYPDYTIKH